MRLLKCFIDGQQGEVDLDMVAAYHGLPPEYGRHKTRLVFAGGGSVVTSVPSESLFHHWKKTGWRHSYVEREIEGCRACGHPSEYPWHEDEDRWLREDT